MAKKAATKAKTSTSRSSGKTTGTKRSKPKGAAKPAKGKKAAAKPAKAKPKKSPAKAKPAKAAKKASSRPTAKPAAKASAGKAKKPVAKAASKPTKAKAPVVKKAAAPKPVPKPVAKPAPAKPIAKAAPVAPPAPKAVVPKAAPVPPPPPAPAPPKPVVIKKKPLKERFSIEFLVHSTPSALYDMMLSPSGFSEWYCDDVDVRGDEYTFKWGNDEEKTKLIGQRQNEVTRWHRMDDDDPESFYEFRIKIDPITNELALIVTDHAWPAEIENAKALWASQIANLIRVLGA